jgi:hypothetical protein
MLMRLLLFVVTLPNFMLKNALYCNRWILTSINTSDDNDSVKPVDRDLRTNSSGGDKGSSNDSVAPVRSRVHTLLCVMIRCGNPLGL